MDSANQNASPAKIKEEVAGDPAAASERLVANGSQNPTMPPAIINKVTPKPKLSKPVLTDKFSQELITLLSGPPTDLSSFVVHKCFAVHYSPVLKAAFEHQATAAPHPLGITYQLDEEDKTTTEFLVQWLYTQDIQPAQLKPDATYNSAEILSIVKLWLLAERLEMPSLQNAAIKKINDCHTQFRMFNYNDINYIWSATKEGSLLRLYYIDLMFVISQRCFTKFVKTLEKNVLGDLATACMLRVENKKSYTPGSDLSDRYFARERHCFGIVH
ncbi:hypothetical protein HYFRA_00006894 [Hymenoscyphus fraxineus]|uniref:BTB domain-containing protein n=1 Tax=Hymenoscyphus fraxineus TaxID=746836 RepID=A0A9N9KNV7_9HELO|nr:hypothetical protein HYFRA_00006894 [Hymenoscyphus fraxineus]